MQEKLINPLKILQNLWGNRELIYIFSKRDVIGRYKGSSLGLIWSFLNPLIMLVIYTFVFSVVFKARWGDVEGGSKVEFALILFVGLIVHGFLAEVLNRAPSLIISNINYVKKVVFPLEILSIISIGSALFHFVISFIVLLSACLIVNGTLHWTIIFAPIILFPLIILLAGISWIMASLGVYLRDMSQFISIITMLMLFLSPVFYPISALPEQFQSLLLLNPITFIIEQERNVLIWGNMPDWFGLGIYTLIAIVFAYLGYIWFSATRKGFSDVL